MKRNEITDAMIKAIGDGIREYNISGPPILLRAKDGKQLPLNEAEKTYYDQRWYEAVRHGMNKICET